MDGVLMMSFVGGSNFVGRANEETKARRAVRTSNFTQQTNALDVDKHMCVPSLSPLLCPPLNADS